MPGLIKFPTFPADVPTHPLLVIDYTLLKAGDHDELDKFWKAATELGFWYLKNHGIDHEVNAMFDLGAQTFALPAEEKVPYSYKGDGSSFGYKPIGTNVIDEKGTRDTTEAMDVAQDDVLAYPKSVHHTYPVTVRENMNSVLRPFVEKSMEINMYFLSIMDDRLGLPQGTLAGLNKPEEPNGGTVRLIRAAPAITPNAQTFVTAHTDFGALTLLHNRLGGLQVLVPGVETWQYVKPLEGHIICNIGDALHFFSGGILRSNIHRVIPPPKEQAKLERWSLVFFTRPNFNAPLRPLSQHSTIIANAVVHAPNPGKFDTGMTAGEWLAHRNAATRATKYKDPSTWKASFKGTEDREILGVVEN
ncbi:Clavaminate synthase-like protein [Lentinus tigrinus ALCF2SS1-7]|uniref:Clavaminate synthase-like protein n=1 Tax=Lentinus tigrinus ALCF2SS1-6 TaxID=1328759 RepID=A0A5C2RU13_9APHY|nr:Clavaminate synthase-like protein [Lentinus tigrinus ALCF2SS1-6]RPD70293.1 Clavaminate synthase-like protein [Lentinus tigrinus ALCF2SS1-7]